MNLSAIANGITSSVNPNIEAVLKVNDGYDVDEYGVQVPSSLSSKS